MEKQNAQLKSITTFGPRAYLTAIPGNSARTVSEPAGFVPLGSSRNCGQDIAWLALDERGLTKRIESAPDIAGAVEKAMQSAARGRRGTVPSTAKVLAEWKFFLPTNVDEQNALVYFKLVYQYVARMSGIADVLGGRIRGEELSVFFIPGGLGRHGENGRARNTMSREQYLGFYKELKGYLAEEMGFVPDLDADDGMFASLGYSQDERAKSIADRESAAEMAKNLGSALESQARDFARDARRTFGGFGKRCSDRAGIGSE